MRNVLAIVVLATLSFPALADRADDMKLWPAVEYCEATTNWFHGGARAKAGGHARSFREMTPGMVEMLEHRGELPKDQMWVPELGSMTDNEQAFLKHHVLNGYDASSESLPADEINKLSQEYYAACMQDRDEK